MLVTLIFLEIVKGSTTITMGLPLTGRGWLGYVYHGQDDVTGPTSVPLPLASDTLRKPTKLCEALALGTRR